MSDSLRMPSRDLCPWCDGSGLRGSGTEPVSEASPLTAQERSEELERLKLQLSSSEEEIQRLRTEAAWIRRKVELPEDASSTDVYGKMHSLAHAAHGYHTYIEAYKCNDKQGEIARLTCRAEATESSLHALQARVLTVIEGTKVSMATGDPRVPLAANWNQAVEKVRDRVRALFEQKEGYQG